MFIIFNYVLGVIKSHFLGHQYDNTRSQMSRVLQMACNQ